MTFSSMDYAEDGNDDNNREHNRRMTSAIPPTCRKPHSDFRQRQKNPFSSPPSIDDYKVQVDCTSHTDETAFIA